MAKKIRLMDEPPEDELQADEVNAHRYGKVNEVCRSN